MITLRDTLVNLGYRIEEVRVWRKMTRARLAELVDVSDETIYHYERSGVWPRSENMVALVNALDVKILDLFDVGEKRAGNSGLLQHQLVMRGRRAARGAPRPRKKCTTECQKDSFKEN